MNTQQLIEKMSTLLETIKVEQSKDTKKGKNEARKAASELKQIAAEFKRQSVAEGKAK